MDEFVGLHLLEELEVAEEAAGGREIHVGEVIAGDPFRELSNSEFVNLFRLTKELTNFLIGRLEPFLQPKKRPGDVDVSVKVLVALRFFAAGSYQLDVGQNRFFCVSQPTVSRCIKEVYEALNRQEIFDTYVKFPQNIEEMNSVRQKFFEKHNFPGVIGCIDCTHVAIFPPKRDDPLYPEHLYVNRKGYHSINVQLVCDSDLKILNVNAKYPGSSNDAFIWNNSNLQTTLRNLHEREHKDYFLLGHSGYPLRTWLLTPLEQEPEPNTPEHRYNIAHRRTRVDIECCNGAIKNRWRCLLKHRVLHYSPEVACQIINACVVLHNICIEYNVPVPEEQDQIEEFDFGADNGDIAVEQVARRINPELADGRIARTQLISRVFRN